MLEDPSAPLPEGAPAVPTQADYSAAGVTDAAHFTDEDLWSLADVLATEGVNGAAVATSAQVQAVVASWQRIRAEADGTRLDMSQANPEAADWLRIGARVGSAATWSEPADTTGQPVQQSNASAHQLLVQLLGRQSAETLQRVADLNALGALVDRLMDVAAGRQPITALSLDDLQAFGLSGLTPANFSRVCQVIANSADDGRDVDSLAELQAMVPNATQTIAQLRERSPEGVQFLRSAGLNFVGDEAVHLAPVGLDLNADGLADLLTAGIVGRAPFSPRRSLDWYDPQPSSEITLPVMLFDWWAMDFAGRTALGEEPGREWLVRNQWGDIFLMRQEGATVGENIAVENLARVPQQVISWDLMDGSGDFNGDGLLDVVLGADNALYLIYGTAEPRSEPLSVQNLQDGIGGLRLGISPSRLFNAGFAGDVNGDGIDDIFAYRYFNEAGRREQVVTVLLGGRQPSTETIDLSEPGERGYLISGVNGEFYTLSAAGDVNGDGFSDLFFYTPDYSRYRFEPYVIFGSANTSDVIVEQGQPMRNGEAAGFRIDARDLAFPDSVLDAISLALGDVNGDGLDDLALSGDNLNRTAGGMVVVFGRNRTDLVDGAGIVRGEPGGFAVTDAVVRPRSQWGRQVATAGDVDGDGLQDLVATSFYSWTNEATVVIQADADPSWIALDILGGDDADRLVGAWGSDRIAGGQGNDTLVGGGGADVLYGGAGDDRFELNASNAQALRTAQGGPDDVMRVNGGTGIDTVALVGNGLAGAELAGAGQPGTGLGDMLGDGLLLDLRQVPDNRLQSLERWDLSDPGAQTLVMGLSDLLQSGRRALWDTGLLQAVQWMVEGGSEDTVQLHGEWSAAGHYEDAGGSYTRYHHTGTVAELLVGPGVRVELMG